MGCCGDLSPSSRGEAGPHVVFGGIWEQCGPHRTVPLAESGPVQVTAGAHRG